jgi:ribosomal protein L40E
VSESEAAQLAFCGACGTQIAPDAQFCRRCGTAQAQFAEREPDPQPTPEPPPEPEPEPPLPPEPEPEPAPAPVDVPATLDVLDASVERHGFAPSQAPEGNSSFRPEGTSLIGELCGLPTRVDEGRRPDGTTRLLRVRFSAVDGDPKVAATALSEAQTWSVSSSSIGVEALATAEQYGADGGSAYVEDLARRCAAALEVEGSTRPGEDACIFTVSGYPQWVTTSDPGVDGVELRHFELDLAQADWGEMGVHLGPTADGAMAATGTWDEEETLISLMGRIAMVKVSASGESPVAFGSGICTLTNRRLVAGIYARPDDEMLKNLDMKATLRAQGITFQDASGRAVDPLLSMSEAEKVLQFIDIAGAVDEEGGGTVLALSAFPQAFAAASVEGGMLRRGLGIPGVQLTGGPLNLHVQPLRVLDRDSHTVKPQRGEIKEAVDAWWAMTMQAGQQEATPWT